MPSSYKAATVGKFSQGKIIKFRVRKEAMCICSYYNCATSVKVLVRSEWTLQLDGIIFVNFYIIILVSHIKYTVQDLIEIISRESLDTMNSQIYFTSVTCCFWPIKFIR